MALLFPCKKAGGIGLTSLAITTAPTKTTYAQYDSLDLTGLKVTATFKDGLVADVTDLCQITPADGSELNDYGNLDITIKYANKTVTQSITVNQMTAIAVTTQPTKTRYLVGENLDLTGIAVTATAGALIRNVTNLANYTPPNGTTLDTERTQRVDVEYADFNTFFNVNVISWLLKKTPFVFRYGSAVVYNNEIHILGGSSSLNYHYKFNGTSWVSVSTLPYDYYYGSAVIYNNEIHILGGSLSKKNHYKFNGTSWISVSTLPYDFLTGSAVVYNNEIHILGGGNNSSGTSDAQKHYKFNGTSWVSASTLPYKFYGQVSAVVYNNEIHAFGFPGHYMSHYKFNGTSWLQDVSVTYNFSGSAVVYNNEIHLLGDSSNNNRHQKFNGSNWSSLSELPYLYGGTSVVVIHDKIIMIGASYADLKYYDAEWNGTSWTLGID